MLAAGLQKKRPDPEMTVLSDPGVFISLPFRVPNRQNLLLPLYCYGIISSENSYPHTEQPHTFHIIKIARTSVPVVEW